MTALLRRILGRRHTNRATCPFCLDRVPVERLTLHVETNHAGDQE